METQLEVIEGGQPNKPRRSRAVAVATPSAMIAQAIASGAGVEVMEKLMTLHERWQAMEAKKAFALAMKNLRANMPALIKNQRVDYTPEGKGRVHYQYEDLNDVTSALDPVMSAVGLNFRWRTESNAERVTVICVIEHQDGHSEETSLSAPHDKSGGKNSIQAVGSAVTYLQRYTLKAAVGIAAAKDDDGIAAVGEPAPAATKAQKSAYEVFSGEVAGAKSEGALKAIWKRMNDTHADDLPQAEYDRLADAMNDRLAVLRDPPKQGRDDFPGDLTPSSTLDHQFGAR